VSCPKSLCYQKTHFGPLGVKEAAKTIMRARVYATIFKDVSKMEDALRSDFI